MHLSRVLCLRDCYVCILLYLAKCVWCKEMFRCFHVHASKVNAIPIIWNEPIITAHFNSSPSWKLSNWERRRKATNYKIQLLIIFESANLYPIGSKYFHSLFLLVKKYVEIPKIFLYIYIYMKLCRVIFLLGVCYYFWMLGRLSSVFKENCHNFWFVNQMYSNTNIT